jgi:hypothetical protein
VNGSLRTAAATLAVLMINVGVVRADNAPATQPAASLFRDPQDNGFDVSGFLDTRTGFLPIVVPITEPAVDYGLGVGLTFFHKTRPRVMETRTARASSRPISPPSSAWGTRE